MSQRPRALPKHKFLSDAINKKNKKKPNLKPKMVERAIQSQISVCAHMCVCVDYHMCAIGCWRSVKQISVILYLKYNNITNKIPCKE